MCRYTILYLVFEKIRGKGPGTKVAIYGGSRTQAWRGTDREDKQEW